MSDRNVYVIDGQAARSPDDRVSESTERYWSRVSGHEGPEASAAGAPGGWPRLGATLSLFVNGSGHLLHRRWKVGAFYLLGFCSVPALHYLLHLFWPDLAAAAGRYELGEVDLLFGLLLVDLFFVAVLLGGVYSAYATGRAYSGDPSEPDPSPIGPALASLFVPGWGQIVSGQIVKAMVFLSVFYAGILVLLAWWAVPGPIERLVLGLDGPLRPAVVVAGLTTLGTVTWALSLYDAILVARHRRRFRS